MTKEQNKLIEFLAWVEDNFTWISDDDYLGVQDGDHYTREQIVEYFENVMI